MQYFGKVTLALSICSQLILSACSNDAEFVSTNKTGENSENAAPKNADGKSNGGGEQDELPAKGEKDASTGDSSEVSPDSSTRDPEPEISTIEREFQTTVVEDSAIKFMPKLGLLKQEFTLTSTYENLDRNFSQITRQNVTKMYRQGNPGQSMTDNLKQSDQGILDLLIVVDNSGSMKQEQEKVSTKLADILEYVKDSDWRIGIVTTDPANGCSRAVVKKGDADASTAFANGINAGIAGSGNERGILQAVKGLSCATAPFVRPNSTVAVLIVSDEDNCSNNGSDCPNDPWNKPEYLTDYLKNTMNRKLGVDARVYGLYWDPTKTCTGGAFKAVQYAKAVADTQGTSGSICDADYSATLQKISQDVAAILKAEFKLAAAPDAGSTVVKVNGVVVPPADYTVTADVLRFTVLPPKGALIAVTYTVGAVPMKDRYGLDEVPAANTVKVLVNGAMVDANDYTIDNTNKELVFKTKPVANADIKIDFLRNTPLLKDFEIGPNVKDGSVKVKVNDVATTAFTVNSTGRVTMNNAPIDGAVIAVNFDKLVGPVLEYALPLVGSKYRDLRAFDKINNTPVAVTVREDGKIAVDVASHVEGKTVVLLYKNEDSNKVEVSLPHQPIMDSIDIQSGDVACELGMGVELVDMVLKINCDWQNEDETSISFKYKKTPIKTFVVPELLFFKSVAVKVFVNDEETKEFSLSGPVIVVNSEVPYDAIVKITASGVR